MTLRRSVALQGWLLVAALALSLLVAPHLPDRVAIHFGLNGQPDGWGSKWVNLLTMPAVQAFMLALTVALPPFSPPELRVSRFGPTYAWVMLVVGAMMAAMHGVLLAKTSGAAFDVGRALFAILFVFFGALGNVMGKVRRNLYVGVRTPWTLASDRVWDATHRAAGRLWVAGSLLGLLALLLGAPVALLIVWLFVLSLAPVVHSYALSKRIDG